MLILGHKERTRTCWLQNQGFRILRFWNHEVFSESEAVQAVIRQSLSPPPSSSPARGEETPRTHTILP